MMFYFVFAVLWLSPPNVYCNSTENDTILYEKTTQIAFLSKTLTLSCPKLIPSASIQVIIWEFGKTLLPVPITQKETKNTETRYRAGENGSLIIEKVEYSDSTTYKCKAYDTKQLYEVQIEVTVRGPPNKFNSFRYESLSESVLQFSWDINISTSNLVEYYNITLCKSLITKDCNTVSVIYPGYSHTFKNLMAFSEYRSSIVAINNVGMNERSDLVARTLPGTPTARPFILKSVAESRNVTLIIECVDCASPEKMKGILQSFLITYDDGSGKVNRTVSHENKNRIEVNITNLQPYRDYMFNISAYNGVKYGPVDHLICKTKEDYPNPTTYIHTGEVTSDKITVKWSPASDKFGPITGYLIKVFDASQQSNVDNMIESKELGPKIQSYEVVNLKSRTPYTIKLWAINSVGMSKPVSTMSKTDRQAPPELKLLEMKRLERSVRLSWIFPVSEKQTKNYTYYICFKYSIQNKMDQCISTEHGSKGQIQCHCSLNESIHWVDIPLNIFYKNESEAFLWVKISVPSDFCENTHDCAKLESKSSRKKKIKLQEYLKYTKNVIENSGHHLLIVGLVIGIGLILALTFMCAFLLCKNGAKNFCFSSRQNMYYSRPTGEYIEICTRQQSICRILPLEKCPYPPIPMSNLIEHINNHRADDGAGFQAEFEMIESMDTSKWSITHALLKENKAKNRYTNIFPYDHSRVVLQNSSSGKFDYINASFIDGFQRSHAYIATQGPLAETVADFWQMIWEQNSEIIVMISNFVERGRSKCEMYWSSNKILNYGNISVRQIFQKDMAFYTERRFRIRNIRIKKNSKERTVYHYQYTDWRDFDVPPSSLPVLVFVRATTKHWSEASGPIIVHCSAGVGRTGTYICIESQIRKLDMEHQINVRGFLEHIRQQRMKLVQTESQYTFIHDALYEYFLYPDREIHKHELSAYISKLKEIDSTGNVKLDTQFKKCINFEPSDYDYMESKKRYNLVKNRSDIMPIESRRINLSSEPGVEGSNYINASAIQGYWQMKEFIITQHPLGETEQDFWKMVWDENCTLIILLSNENMHQFWPGQDNNARTFRWFRVAHCNSEETDFSVQYSFLMSSSREDYALDCTMHCLKGWPTNVLDSTELLRLLFDINSKKYTGPIVVIDEYGSSRAGIFVAMSSLLHQLRNDDVVNVYFVMKMIHIERPHTFSTSSDLMFIYELLEFVILNQHSYNFFSRPQQDFIPNGFAHMPQKPTVNNYNNVPITHYSTLGTVRSKSSTSTTRRRASSVDSEPYGLQTPSPNRKENFGNRISWNVGETRLTGTPLLSESFIDWPNSVCNGHYNGPSTNGTPFENPHITDLPVAKIVTHQSASQNPQSSMYNVTNNGALDTSTSSSTVWCTQKL